MTGRKSRNVQWGMQVTVYQVMLVLAAAVTTGVWGHGGSNDYSSSRGAWGVVPQEPSSSIEASDEVESNKHYMPPRGGSTMIRQQEEPDRRRAVMDAKSIAAALRLTCEMNRQLERTTLACNGGHDSRHLHHESIEDDEEGGENFALQDSPIDSQFVADSHQHHSRLPVNIHPNQQWHKKIRRRTAVENSKSTQPEATIYHSSKSIQKGVSQFGPELVPYLESLGETLGCDLNADDSNSQIIWTLALIYLDRACSVETPRLMMPPQHHYYNEHHGEHAYGSAVPVACPYVTSRTVHRLMSTALVLANKAVKGGSTHHYATLLEEKFGISESSLSSMEQWMLGALGDYGLMVNEEKVHLWLNAWDATFHPAEHQAQLLAQQQQLYQQQIQEEQQRMQTNMRMNDSSMYSQLPQAEGHGNQGQHYQPLYHEHDQDQIPHSQYAEQRTEPNRHQGQTYQQEYRMSYQYSGYV
uniref:Uncharacterized protein n=1 Tax=Attheya septentrionalis TaxID=420275 RepID=A0A7S2UQE2_9STRA